MLLRQALLVLAQPFSHRPNAREPERTEGLIPGIGQARSQAFPRLFAMGKIRGTLCMRSHISVHPRTTKYFSNSFVVKTEIEKEGLPEDSPAGLGAGGLRFKSGRPDHLLLCFQFTLPDVVCVGA